MTSQKRISAPRTYNIKRKQSTWVTRVNPGPHDKNALPLNVLLRDILKIARNAKEVKRILNKSKVLIDGKVRKNPKFPVGLMDIISIPSLKKCYRITYDSIGRLKCVLIPNKQAELKIVRIKGKSRKGKAYHLTTNDGRSIIVKLSEGKKYSTHDSLLIKVPSQEIIKHLPFIKNAHSLIIGGKHVGMTAVLKEINGHNVVVIINKEECRTIRDYVFIIDEGVKVE